MKIIGKRTFRFILACCVIMSMCFIVSASGTGGRSVVLPDPDFGGATHTKIDTVSCTKLTGEIYSKTITKQGLPSSATKIGVSGTIKHSVGSSMNAYTMQAGIGYFVSGSGEIYPEYTQSFKSATARVYYTTAISGLSRTTNYYAFIKNMAPSYGTVSGSIEAFTLG